MDPSSSNTKKRGAANEAEEVQDGLKRRSCSSSPLPTGCRDETEGREVPPHALIEESVEKCREGAGKVIVNTADLLLKPLPQTQREYELCLRPTIMDTMYNGDEIKSIHSEDLKIGIRDAYSKTIISDGQISSAMVELFLKEVEFEILVPEDKITNLISYNHLKFRLQDGIGYVKGLKIKDSKYWTSNRFVLGVKIIDGPILTKIGAIKEARSAPFKVLKKKSIGNVKHFPTKMASEIWRLPGIMRYGDYSKAFKVLGIKFMGDLLGKYYHEMGPTAVKQFLRKSIPMLDLFEWDDIIRLAKTCVDYDPTKYDQTFTDDDESNHNSDIHNHQNPSVVEENNINLARTDAQVNPNQPLVIVDRESESFDQENNINLVRTDAQVNLHQPLGVVDEENESVDQENNINLVRTDAQVNPDQPLVVVDQENESCDQDNINNLMGTGMQANSQQYQNFDQIRTNLKDFEACGNDEGSRTYSPNYESFLENIHFDDSSGSASSWATGMILESPNLDGIDYRVEQSQELGK